MSCSCHIAFPLAVKSGPDLDISGESDLCGRLDNRKDALSCRLGAYRKSSEGSPGGHQPVSGEMSSGYHHTLTRYASARVCLMLSLHACTDWLLTGSLQKMVLVITSVASKEVLERWTFDIQTDKSAIEEG